MNFHHIYKYGACTTISVYENLSKNSFFIRVGKPTPPVCRSCSRFASAKVGLFHKLAKKRERFFKKKKKKECKKDNNNRNEESTPYYIIYIGKADKTKYGGERTGGGEVRKSKYYLLGNVKVLTLDSNGVDFGKQRPLLFQGDKLRWREENTLLMK